MKSCEKCMDYKDKEFLVKDNKAIYKPYCRCYDKLLKSKKACHNFTPMDDYIAIFFGIVAFLLFFVAVTGYKVMNHWQFSIPGGILAIVSGLFFLRKIVRYK